MHLLGGLLWRLRRVVQRKDRADPPHFLRDLFLHDLRALIRPLPGKRHAAPTKAVRVAVKAQTE